MTRARVPLYEKLVEGFMMKRIMSSYHNLLGEHLRREAAGLLFAGRVPLIHNTYDFISAVFRRINLKVQQGDLDRTVADKLLKYKKGLSERVVVKRKILKKYPELRDREVLLKFFSLPMVVIRGSWPRPFGIAIS